MSKIKQSDTGHVGLIKRLEDGRIAQIALTREQHEMLQCFLSALSKESPLMQMEAVYDLVLKKEKP